MLFNFKDFSRLSDNINNIISQKTSDTEIGQWGQKQILRLLSKCSETNVHDYIDHNFNINADFKQKIEHIVDFLENISDDGKLKQLKGNFEQVFNNAQKWTAQTQKQYRKQTNINETGIRTIMDFGNGYAMVHLSTKENFVREGNLMGHCVGGYNPKTSTIYSLRDKNNEPHATLQITGKNRIKQIKGKSDAAPLPKYQSMIKMFLAQHPEFIVTGDGENIGYYGFENTYYNPQSKEWANVYKNKIMPLQQKKLASIINNIHETN